MKILISLIAFSLIACAPEKNSDPEPLTCTEPNSSHGPFLTEWADGVVRKSTLLECSNGCAKIVNHDPNNPLSFFDCGHTVIYSCYSPDFTNCPTTPWLGD